MRDYTGGTGVRTGLLLSDAVVATDPRPSDRSPLGDYSGVIRRSAVAVENSNEIELVWASTIVYSPRAE